MHGKLRWIFGVAALGALAACSDASDAQTDDDDLTSLSARQRALTFEGVVYVEAGADEGTILAIARKQTQTAFGALLHSDISVQTRELQNVDASSLKKRKVTVVDVGGDGASREMLEVRYTYRDNAVVPVALSRRTSLPLALLGPNYADQTNAILETCTANDKEAKESADDGLLWYEFNPSKASCRRAMEAEQRKIDDAAAKLDDPKTMIPKLRAERTYLPVTMQLARADTATRATYPEYDRLFSGEGAQPGALTIAMLVGRLAHDYQANPRKDSGYYEWMAGLDVLFTDHPDFTLTKIEPAEDIASVDFAGKRYDVGFQDFIQWTVYGRGWPEGMPAAGRDDVADAIAKKLDDHWVTFEKKVKISVDDGPDKELTIRLETLFGADEDPAPHRHAIKRSDVVVYNGHSYIGYGPLDPGNFSASSFPGSYQLLFFDSCVSYNYYEKDFFRLKTGGSRNLDMITNGIEAPEWMSGETQGRFVSKLIGGRMPSYQTLLEAAKPTDSLRVVDGEIDNRFDPNRTRVRIVR